ncbi:MAG: tetratricopeptide repeat protein, partial [Candidatus Electrothrix sp. AUS1_2]|nr:tetratricopeptide repeat protein [Candidatus Electrothrix sp. AUS1_2]
GEGTTLNNIGSIYYAQGNYAKAIEYREQTLAILREQGDRGLEAQCCWNLGLTYEDMGDLAEAEEHIMQAVQIAEQMNHPSLEKYRDGLARMRAILNSRWRFWLYKVGTNILKWLRAKRQA